MSDPYRRKRYREADVIDLPEAIWTFITFHAGPELAREFRRGHHQVQLTPYSPLGFNTDVWGQRGHDGDWWRLHNETFILETHPAKSTVIWTNRKKHWQYTFDLGTGRLARLDVTKVVGQTVSLFSIDQVLRGGMCRYGLRKQRQRDILPLLHELCILLPELDPLVVQYINCR